MNQERLEWVMSGLNQHTLSKTENQFIKTTLEDFSKKRKLTEHQEERLEILYKEKSKMAPNKNQIASPKSSPQKTKSRKPRWKAMM